MTKQQYKESAILFYADFLAMKYRNTPVTDNCKYFFIYGVPVHIAYIVKQTPHYNIEDQYYIESYDTYTKLDQEFGEEGALSFLEDICNLKSCGTVNALTMLKYHYQFNTKRQRNQAYKKYFEWLKNKQYYILDFDENGNEIKVNCTKYIYHIDYERQIHRESNIAKI